MDDWSIEFTTDKMPLPKGNIDEIKQNNSSGFFNWTMKDIKKEKLIKDEPIGDEDVDRIWAFKEECKSPVSVANQSTFEMAIEEEVSRPATSRPIKEEVYSEEMTPIFGAIDRDRGDFVDRKGLPTSSRDYYSCKFRPIACSTPNWQAPMLSIIETQLSQQMTMASEKKKQAKQIKMPQEGISLSNGTSQKDKDKERSSEIAGLKLREEEDLIDSQVTLPPNDIIIDAFKQLIEKTTIDKDNVGDMGGDGDFNDQISILNFKKYEERSPVKSTITGGSGDGNFCDVFNLIPEVMVTSYFNSTKDRIIEDSPFMASQAYKSSTEANRDSLIKRIEDIVLESIRSLIKNNNIDGSIMAYAGAKDEMDDR